MPRFGDFGRCGSDSRRLKKCRERRAAFRAGDDSETLCVRIGKADDAAALHIRHVPDARATMRYCRRGHPVLLTERKRRRARSVQPDARIIKHQPANTEFERPIGAIEPAMRARNNHRTAVRFGQMID
jgi:hypothetical protein